MKRHIGISLLVSAALLLTLVGGVSATGQELSISPMSPIANLASPQTALGTAFTYQGQLSNNGSPVNANCDFQFALYDAVSGGNQIGTTQAASNTRVSNGLFTVSLDFGNVFTGDARWLDIAVRCPAGSGTYTPLTPRQALTGVPYALGLRPGAVISGTAPTGLTVINSGAGGIFGQTNSNYDAGVYGYNTSATGNAVWGYSVGGVGTYGQSNIGIGVKGYSAGNTGVSGRSDLAGNCSLQGCTEFGGIGVYGENNLNNGTGVEGVANDYWGKGVLGNSNSGTGISGDSISGTGVGGNSSSGTGISGDSISGAGVWGRSSTGYGVSGVGGSVGVYAHNTTVTTNTAYLASDCCAGDFYGNVYVHGNLTVSGSKTGYVVDLAINAGNDTLSAGDIVAVIGSDPPMIGAIPVARVIKANVAYQIGVIGIVDQHVIHDATSLTANDEPVAPGEYVNVVTLGMFRTIKVDASFGAIHAGDLLVASPHAGYAMKATDRAQATGAIVGKALGNLDSGVGTVPVFVTLQ